MITSGGTWNPAKLDLGAGSREWQLRISTAWRARHRWTQRATPGHGGLAQNLAVTALRLSGATNIAAALHHHARDTHRPLAHQQNHAATLPGPWVSGRLDVLWL
ncbi:MAG TPA: hypothetical protein VGP04_19830 [Pseudonocardiaceae bacterium]|nr:hypothetical protein [Pseudonocardiaceae bacterium]